MMGIKMYAIADKYELDKLKEVAKTAFENAARHHWDTDEFVFAVRGVYTTTPESDRGLRDIVKNITWCHRDILLARKDVQEVLEKLEGFSMDLVRELCKTASSLAPPDYGMYCEVCCERTLPAMNPGIIVCGICDEVYRYPVVLEEW